MALLSKLLAVLTLSGCSTQDKVETKARMQYRQAVSALVVQLRLGSSFCTCTVATCDTFGTSLLLKQQLTWQLHDQASHSNMRKSILHQQPALMIAPVCRCARSGSSDSPRTVVSLGPTQSRMGPTKTGPKFRAKMPTVHNTANLLSCVGQRVSDPPAFRITADKQASAQWNAHISVL